LWSRIFYYFLKSGFVTAIKKAARVIEALLGYSSSESCIFFFKVPLTVFLEATDVNPKKRSDFSCSGDEMCSTS